MSTTPTAQSPLRALGGGNTVRFLLSWAYAEPVRGQVDTAYLSAATAQIGAFLDAGIRVYHDFHQDLYSRWLFDADSWYTGDGAPEWAVELGDYPDEFCGICPFWGQNITSNAAVTEATSAPITPTRSPTTSNAVSAI